MNALHYNSLVQSYFERPLLRGGSTLTGAAGSREQGTQISLSANLNGDRLSQVGFRAFACPHIIAACHGICERLEGRPVAALLDMPLDELRAEFDIPVEKTGKLLILQDALRDCYACYAAGQAQPGPP